jgi:hypothetical protein
MALKHESIFIQLAFHMTIFKSTILSTMLFSFSYLLAPLHLPVFQIPVTDVEHDFYSKLKRALIDHKTKITVQQTSAEMEKFTDGLGTQLIFYERCSILTISAILEFLKKLPEPEEEALVLFAKIFFTSVRRAFKSALLELFHWQETDASQTASKRLCLVLGELFKNIFEGKHESLCEFFALLLLAEGPRASKNPLYMHMAMNWLISFSSFALSSCTTIEEEISLLIMLSENLIAFLALPDHPFQTLMLTFKAFLHAQAKAVQQKEGLLYSPAQHKLLIVIQILENYTDAASLQRLSALTCDFCTAPILVDVATIAAHPSYKFHLGCLQRAMAPGDDLTAADGTIIPGTGKVAGCPMCRGMHPPAEIQVQCNPHGIRFAPPPATPLIDIILGLRG